jgi:hypothetical protein
MKPQRNYLLLAVAVCAVILWAGLGAIERWQSARNAAREADIVAAKETAAAAKAAADAAQARADAIRSEIDSLEPTIIQGRTKIERHRNAPIDENADPRDLVHSFVLLGYGLPRE